MKFNFSKKIFILSLVVFVVVAISDVIIVDLLSKKIININDKIRQLDISSRERERKLQLEDVIESTEIERGELAKYFVGTGNAETVNFTKYLENLAVQNGVTQRKTLDYEAVRGLEASEVVSAIRFKMTVSGKWSNVYNFIQAVENLPKVSYINTVSMNIGTDKVGKVTDKVWSADIDFSVIKLKD